LLTILASDTPFPFCFGVELELALVAKDFEEMAETLAVRASIEVDDYDEFGNVEAQRFITYFLRDEGIAVYGFWDRGVDKWSVVNDVSIENSGDHENFCQFGFPVLDWSLADENQLP
jgi:hypothetical protein